MSFEAFEFRGAVIATPVPPETDSESTARFEIRVGWAIVASFLAVFALFGYLVRLDAAVSANGSVKVAGNRQVVQSRDGGAITALHVHEGDRVRAGQVLIELAGGEAEAIEHVLASQVIGLEAEQARLIAERDNAGSITYPSIFIALSGEDRRIADDAVRLQNGIFTGRRLRLHDERGVLAQQASELNARIAGLDEQRRANHQQAALFDDQLDGVRTLASQGYASSNRVRELERARAALEGDAGNITASAAATREQIAETHMRSLELGSQDRETTSDALQKNAAALNDALPKWAAARETLEATKIRATASGQVMDLQVFTVGGVVQAGQRLLDIVPDARPLVIEAMVSPSDAGELSVGQTAEIRFPTIHDRRLPIMSGRVTRVSADDLVDEKSGAHYFTCEVTVPRVDPEDQRLVKPGIPAQIMVALRKRSAIDYLLEPLDQALWRSGSER